MSQQRQALQGKENPPGSGKYPEPKWLGMIQHDMMMFDHGMPLPDGTMRKEQRPEADVNIEFQSKLEDGGAGAGARLGAAARRTRNTPPTIRPRSGSHMTNTDSTPFHGPWCRRSASARTSAGTQIGSGWDPQWHQPTDVFTTYSDADFRLGLNAARD